MGVFRIFKMCLGSIHILAEKQKAEKRKPIGTRGSKGLNTIGTGNKHRQQGIKSRPIRVLGYNIELKQDTQRKGNRNRE